jgi:hypothetical protein
VRTRRTNNLKLITWNVHDGKFTRMADSEDAAGEVGEIAILIHDRLVVTAVRDGRGRLRLISWHVPSGLGSVTRLRPDTGNSAGEADHITIVGFFNVEISPMLVTPVRAGSGSLKLITWWLSTNGVIQRIADSGDVLPVSSITSMPIHPLRTLVTAVLTPTNPPTTPPTHNLRLLTWKISRDGQTITKQGDSGDLPFKVPAEEVALHLGPRTEAGRISIITAVSVATGQVLVVGGRPEHITDLKLITWTLNDDGSDIRKHGDSGNQGEAEKIAIAQAGVSPTYITASNNKALNLQLKAFEAPGGTRVDRTTELNTMIFDINEHALVTLGDGHVVGAFGNPTTMVLRTLSISEV